MADTLREHLEKQGQTLEDLNKNVKGLSGSISQMVRQTAEANLRAREERNDARLAAMAAQRGGGAPAAGGGTGGGAGGGRGGKVGFMDRVGQGMGLGTGFAAVRAAGKRLGVAALMQMSADFLGDQVEEATGSTDLGDATQRALKLGSFGVLFGKKIGAIAAFVGAVATDENIAQLESLGEKINIATADIQAWFGAEGVLSVEKALEKLSNGINKSLQFMNDLFDPDKSFSDAYLNSDLADPAALASGVYGIQQGRSVGREGAKELFKKMFGKESPIDYEFDDAQRREFNKATYASLSDKQKATLASKGLKAAKDGSLRINGDFAKVSAVDDILRSAGIKSSGQSNAARAALQNIINERAMAANPRFANVFKFARKLPLIGPFLTTGALGGIILDEEMPLEQKLEEGAGLLGSVGGATLGGVLGAMIGAPAAGVGGIVTGAIGAMGGALAGEYLARELMKYILTGDEGVVGATKAANQLTQNATGGGGATGGGQGPVFTLPPTSGARVTSATSESSALAGAPNYIIMDNSQKSISAGGSGATSMFNFGGSAFYDQFDPLAGTRTAGS